VNSSATKQGLGARFLLFSGVGVIGTVAHYLTLISAVEFLGARPITGSSAGFVVGALVNYALNYKYTFRSSRSHLEALPRFYLIATVGFVFNGSIMWLLAEHLEFNYILSQIAASGLVLGWNFLANVLWTFSERETR